MQRCSIDLYFTVIISVSTKVFTLFIREKNLVANMVCITMKSKCKRKWKREDMENALKACKEGTAIHKAAEKFRVPKSSLQGKSKIGS